MNNFSLPGFTAGCSVYSTHGQFQTVASGNSFRPDAEVRPQRVFCGLTKDGDFTCVDPLCRFRCRSKRGAALQQCLSNCD
jgi:hypothetical protein